MPRLPSRLSETNICGEPRNDRPNAGHQPPPCQVAASTPERERGNNRGFFRKGAEQVSVRISAACCPVPSTRHPRNNCCADHESDRRRGGGSHIEYHHQQMRKGRRSLPKTRHPLSNLMPVRQREKRSGANRPTMNLSDARVSPCGCSSLLRSSRRLSPCA